MTAYHLVLTGYLGVEARRAQAAAGLAPRHFLVELATALGGQIHEPDPAASAPARLLHRVLKTPPALIALAREVAARAGDTDVVFCLGEAAALPLADELRRQRKATRLLSFGHNLRRPRIRAAQALSGCVARIDRFFVFTHDAVSDPARFVHYTEQTDDRFFRPGDTPARTRRARIVSVGLERRDYVTLAEAVRGLDAQVNISAFSKDALPGSRTRPAAPPPNWDMRFYEWPDLAALYRSADLVVIPLEPSDYAAGITTLLEAAAAGCAVIASDTGGLRDAFAAPDAVEWVRPGDAQALRRAISALLGDAGRRAELAAAAHAAQQAHHGLDARVADMAAVLRALAD
ncbi:MAG: glycosyltransferase [Jhaorihella sp.]